jgi:RimJ/RimL family protein N-acetyltransferase
MTTSPVVAPTAAAAMAEAGRQAVGAGLVVHRTDPLNADTPLPLLAGAGLGAGGTAVVLGDGSAVLIRQIQATDAPLLAGIFARLSPTSRWMRFLAAKNHLTDAELRYLTVLDHHDHDAVIALDRGGHGVGVARYIRHPEDPHTAELAIAVVDDWHRRGLGTQLLTQLSDRARHQGIHRFTALMSADNEAMAALLHTMNAEVTHCDSSTVEYQITLARTVAHHAQPGRRAG